MSSGIIGSSGYCPPLLKRGLNVTLLYSIIPRVLVYSHTGSDCMEN